MVDQNEDILQKLRPSIVEIISDKDSNTLGTGFIVSDEGLVVTCRHVITDSQDNLMSSVGVRFHSDSETDLKKFSASPLKENDGYKDDPSLDRAVLKLEWLPEKGVTSVKLDDKVVSLNHFASIGYRKADEFTGLSARGEIRIATRIRTSEGRVSPIVIQLYSTNEIEPGMSGAPVLDIERGRVVGIITERYKEEYNPAINNMAFALPVTSMIDLYPILRKKNQG
jgi:S1-C subfamily serine protease